jgi:hypothetical protein
MFDKRRVLREGLQAEAVVLHAGVTMSRGDDSATSIPERATYKLRVHFDDGTTTER